MTNILIINGPNLNMLGKRPSENYGTLTLEEILDLLSMIPNVIITHYQSNSESEIIDILNDALDKNFDGIIINPAAFTHTSIAIRDALEILTIPKVEVHLSNINDREEFRKINFIKDVVDKSYMGLKEQGYIEAVKYLKNLKSVV